MDEVMYKIVFEGDLMPGFEQQDVQKQLAKLFHIEAAVAARLFNGKPREIKHGVAFDQAKKYVRAMSKLGALAFMLPDEGEETTVPAANDGVAFTKSGSFDGDAFAAYFESLAANSHYDDTFEVPQLLDQGAIEKTEWDEVSGERKVREIEKIAKQILQQSQGA